tara:strand:+ start:98 stop:664 length:567 start_codon:yes stop_codon:yes gene_type:complete
MHISKKSLLIGLIFISSIVFLFFISFGIKKNNTNYDKVFLEPNKEASLREINFYDIENNQFFLEDFKGKVLLINLWATWCLPCKIEMPALDRLQASIGDDNFEVIAIAVEKTNILKIQEFYQEIGLNNLKIYHDNSTKSGLYSKAKGLPLTFLLDHEGNEVGRRDGPWEWDDDEVIEIIKSYKKLLIN